MDFREYEVIQMTKTPHNTPHNNLLEIIDSHYDYIKQLFDCFDINESGCWEWNGRRDKSSKELSYGRINLNVDGIKRDFRAHRVSYAYYNGVDPKHLFVCHKCDNPPCINPSHLFLGTAKDNMLDASKKGRFPNQKGSFNRASKIKDDDAKEIIRRIMVGENNKKIANDFPISHSQVSLIRRGKAWRELSELMGYEVQEKYQSIKVSV